MNREPDSQSTTDAIIDAVDAPRASGTCCKLFLSHNTDDDKIARPLQRALGDHGLTVWIDSREMRGGDLLTPEVKRAIEDADAFMVLVSPNSLQSDWVADELDHAIEVQKQRRSGAAANSSAANQPGDKYRVIPLSLDGTKLGVLKKYFGDAPVHIPISSAAGGIEAAVNAILVALGKREPADVAPTPQPPAEPLEELVLELTDLKLEQLELQQLTTGQPAPGAAQAVPSRDITAPSVTDPRPVTVRRATARARLTYKPATPGQRPVTSAQAWRLVAPLGPIEIDQLRWYLEKYAIWPGGPFRDRAREIAESLAKWGQLLCDAAMPAAYTTEVRAAWGSVAPRARRRFSVSVDATLEAGTPDADKAAVREAATLLLGLPWELLHDGESFLFQGAKPTRVRRRLPNTRNLDVAVVATPIRILLICARPEDSACSYIDHRISALPLVDAMEQLPGQVQLHILTPPTLPALRKELDRARDQGEPYHVVHFDGHGVYDRRIGLGGLCFEHPDDARELKARRHDTIFTDELGPLLKDHRIPLVYLEACQSAAAEQASESVASEMLQQGVASVVAMSHSVLIETARRFVGAFYAKLAAGGRVGDAMLTGQQYLSDDTRRGQIFGAGELRLEDWFVPVLFQEEEDPQLFRETPAKQTQDDFQQALQNRLGKLPPPPSTGFIGRSRELLALERLLERERYAVLRGQGGEGKTTLAAEFARWMVRSQRCQRAAFVSVETHTTARAVLDALGQQLVPDYSVATFASLTEAELPVARALVEQPTLLVVDNLESILAPPHLAAEPPDALADDARAELTEILALCDGLCRKGDTRLVLTSREPLPAPFDGARNRSELHRLGREDAIQLVERVVRDGAGTAGIADATRIEIDELVEAVHGHARTLALLAPSLRDHGVTATHEALAELMADMDRKFPGQREQSLFASVELSLRRLSPDNRQRVRVLGVFHGGVDLDVLRHMTAWDEVDTAALARELVETGLATPNRFNHLSLDPALCLYLCSSLDDAEREALMTRWTSSMRVYVDSLYHHDQNVELVRALTKLELPNLLALLQRVVVDDDTEATIDLATRLQTLFAELGRPRLLTRVSDICDAAAARIGATWSHAHFEAKRGHVEQLLADNRLADALRGAQALLDKARAEGEHAYVGADYDLAGSCYFLGHVLRATGRAEQALPYIDEAQRRCELMEQARPGRAARMAFVCLTKRGDCLRDLGRLNEAAATYEESIRQAEQLQDERGIGITKLQLGTVRLLQERYPDALAAFIDAQQLFTRLGEPKTVASAWHQIGRVYQEKGELDAAEDAYRQSLIIEVQLGNVRGQVQTLGQLGILYILSNRLEEAASLQRTAAELAATIGSGQLEGHAWNNLGETLRKLARWDEARQAIRRAIECKKLFGHAAEPWKTWAILADIEVGADNAELAAEARVNAIACYLAYRRDGGENSYADGGLSMTMATQLIAGDASSATADLDKLLALPELASWLRPFVMALRQIAAGSRDRALADDTALRYTSAAELLLLLDALEHQPVRGEPAP